MSSVPALYQRLLTGAASYEELGNRVLRQIKVAHAFRQVEQVRELAGLLVESPIKEFQLIGQYYLVWCKCRELEYHSDVLERIAEQTTTYKAKALISRAAFDVYQGKIESAFYFYSEALKASSTVSDFTKASTGIAILKSSEGFNKLALNDLENLLPSLRYAEPLTHYELIHSYAIELLAHNRFAEAQNVSAIAMSSPFGPFYPELKEALSEAESQRTQRSTTTVSRRKFEARELATPEPASNVIQSPLKEPDSRVQTAINFMQANLGRRLLLPELASVVNLSASHFSRLFRFDTGLSPVQFLIKLRMERAGQRLATSFLSVKEVMASVGYGNKGLFARHFKRHFDLTPSEYGEQYRRPLTF